MLSGPRLRLAQSDGGQPFATEKPNTLGMHLVDFQTWPFQTSCNVIQNSNVITLSFDVMACQPTFLTDANNNPIHLAPTTIKIDLPSGMSGAITALDHAISEWNSSLGGTGVVLQRVACSSGPYCVPVTVDPQLTSCGFSPTPTTDGTGTITGGARIQLHSTWATFTPSGLRRTFVHEIGHILGLDNFPNNASCTPSAAAMNPTFVCGSTVVDTGTFNDHRPVTKTVYGPTPRVSCGF